MRAVTFEPGREWPRIENLDGLLGVQRAVGNYFLTIRNCVWRGADILIITNKTAKDRPNRIIDGHCLHGTIVICRPRLLGLSLPMAKDLQSDSEWPMAQFVYDEPA